MPPQRLVIEDGEFLKLIVQGHASAYAMNKILKERAGTNENQWTMAYKNIIERLTSLVKAGLIEETKESNLNPNTHGRKDYKVTMKGMELLIYNITTRNEENKSIPIQTIVEYVVRFGMDKAAFEKLLLDRYDNTIRFINFFLRSIKNNPEFASTYAIKAANQLEIAQKEIASLLEFKKISKGKVPKASSSKPTRRKAS